MVTCASETIKASDIMSRDVVCLNEDLDLRECEKILLERGISGAPVVDVDGRLLGVLSKTDIVAHHFANGGEEGSGEESFHLEGVRGARAFSYATAAARDIMTPVPCVASEWATLGELAALMARRAVHRVVVCRNRLVVGIVSSMDILRAIAAEPPQEGWDPGGFPG